MNARVEALRRVRCDVVRCGQKQPAPYFTADIYTSHARSGRSESYRAISVTSFPSFSSARSRVGVQASPQLTRMKLR